jgi:hypothetical protein
MLGVGGGDFTALLLGNRCFNHVSRLVYVFSMVQIPRDGEMKQYYLSKYDT